MNSDEVYVVMTNVPDQGAAMRIAHELVSARLAACVNVLAPCRSVYQWEGKIEDSMEVPMLIKCKASSFPALEAELKALHPYELPEIIAIPLAMGSKAYLDWVAASTPHIEAKS